MVKTQVPRDTKTEPATAPSTTTTEAPDDQVQHKLRTQKQTDATRTNGIKARRNDKIKVSAHKIAAAVAALDKASSDDRAKAEATVNELECRIPQYGQVLGATYGTYKRHFGG
ncbi:hypothetical protein ON010_g9045 [Phytophthora cinnamomi]|nr:hypothetical protein ON010_g9045 [Phytophthora cinnamomi]